MYTAAAMSLLGALASCWLAPETGSVDLQLGALLNSSPKPICRQSSKVRRLTRSEYQ